MKGTRYEKVAPPFTSKTTPTIPAAAGESKNAIGHAISSGSNILLNGSLDVSMDRPSVILVLVGPGATAFTSTPEGAYLEANPVSYTHLTLPTIYSV